MSFYGIIGIAGVGFYLGSYALLQFGLLRSAGYVYSMLNLIAASCVALSFLDAFNLSSLLIQVSWIVISLIGLTRIWMFRNLNRFSLDDRKFGDAVLSRLDDVDLKRLLNVGEWETLPAGTILTEQGQPVDALVYLATGKAEVQRDGHAVATMSTARFIGEMTCMTGEPATATVRLVTEARLLKLPASAFRSFVTRQPVVRDHIELAFARDLRRKLAEHMHKNVLASPLRVPQSATV